MPSGAASRVASPALRPALCYLPRPPGSSSAGAARTAQLRSRRSSLGLFPSPPAPSLTTSPSSSHHVQLPDHSPPPPLGTRRCNTPGGTRGRGPVRGPTGWNPRPLGALQTQRSIRAWVARRCQLSMSRSPALLLLLRAPLDRIGQQCGACHWPGEAAGALIGRARARGAPHSTVSERFETPNAPLSACGRGGGAREGAREEERCECRDKKFPCARERVNCS